MELTLDIVKDHLPDSCPRRRLSTSYKRLAFSSFAIYEEGEPLQPDVLYVARGETLPARSPDQGVSLVLVGGTLPAKWSHGNHDVLQVLSNVGLYQVANDVAEVFRKFDHWEEALYRELIKEADFDIGKMLRLGVEMLRNPLYVSNNALVHLMSADYDDAGDGGPGSIKVDMTYSVSPYVAEMRNAARAERLVKGPFFSSVTVYGGVTYCCNIFLDDFFVGCIGVVGSRATLRESDYDVANYFFSLFEYAFRKYLLERPLSSLPQVNAFQMAVRGLPLGAKEKECLRLQEGERWTVLVLRPQAEDSMPLEPMCATLNATMNQSMICTVAHDEIVGILRSTPPVATNREYDAFSEYSVSMGYLVGYSKAFSDIEELLPHIQFAEYALEFGSKKEGGARLFFDDYVADYILTRFDGGFPVEYLFDDEFRRLLEHDRRSPVSYVETLRLYLDNATNVQKSARQLFIHRSSLINRLEIIRNRIGVDLDSPQRRFQLQLFLRLLESAS